MDSLPRPVLVVIALVTTAGWAANLVSGLLGGPTDGAVNAIYATLVGSGLVFGGVKALRRSSDPDPRDRDDDGQEGGGDDRKPTSHRR